MHIHVPTHTHTHARTNVCMYVCIYVCIYIHTRTCIHARTHTCTCILTQTHSSTLSASIVRACACVDMHVCRIHVLLGPQTHAHTYRYTHLHTCKVHTLLNTRICTHRHVYERIYKSVSPSSACMHACDSATRPTYISRDNEAPTCHGHTQARHHTHASIAFWTQAMVLRSLQDAHTETTQDTRTQPTLPKQNTTAIHTTSMRAHTHQS
jgi:hypothetical protein